MAPAPLAVIREQFNKVGPIPKVNLAGRTVLISGANTGLGYEAAKQFALMNPAKLILAVRSIAKGEAAKKRILAATQCAESAISVWHLDMASFDSVCKFADRVKSECSRLDIFLNNAGILTTKWALTDDGYEST